MELPTTITESVKALNRSSFKETREEWIRPSLDLTGLRLLREKAVRERDLRELYRGRAPYELLQNADDVQATTAAFILTPAGLAFIHDGEWFSVANFRSLADGWSDKDPSQCIGHKGLGFRSVLDVTPAPHVLKIDAKDFFGFKFTWALSNGHIQEIFKAKPKLKHEYKDWTRQGQSACPVMAIPGEVNKFGLGAASSIYDRALRGEYGADLTTMFWFPARDADADQKAVSELDVIPLTSDRGGLQLLVDFVKNDVLVLLPFLASLREVALYEGDSLSARAYVEGERSRQKGAVIQVGWSAAEDKGHADFFQMRFEEPIPPDVKNDSETPKAVRKMKKASLCLSIRLQDGKPIHDSDCLFHVYFPTEDKTGLGVLVHGDFYVKPDRTSLMGGRYNEWLLNIAGRRFAGPYLTELLARFPAKSVFESLRPTGTGFTTASTTLLSSISKALAERKQPFIPTPEGSIIASSVALPSSVDIAGFWHSHFSKELRGVFEEKEAFLDPSVDSRNSREFLDLAGVSPLRSLEILALIEAAAEREEKAAQWWYQCYTYMASQDDMERWNQTSLAGRMVLADACLSPTAVPTESGPAVCLPPADDDTDLAVPVCFQSVFTFLNRELAGLLHRGPDTVRNWLINACGITRFEATDFIPKAVRASVPRLFDETTALKADQLCELWMFVKRIIDTSRSILSPAFWQEVGRLPVPLHFDPSGQTLIPKATLIPAFLAYFPDSFCNAPNAIEAVPDLRRVAETFLSELLRRSESTSKQECRLFLQKAGISQSPKLLRYRRMVAISGEVPFQPDLSGIRISSAFTGERQRDENNAVLRILQCDDAWKRYVASASEEVNRSLHSLSMLEGLPQCAAAAEEHFANNANEWADRLLALVNSLPVDQLSSVSADETARRQASGGVTTEPVESFVAFQLQHYRWLPTSCGPRSSQECFVRLKTRRLISREPSGLELGDALIPYVVADTPEDIVRLNQLGVDGLEDVESAATKSLIQALEVLGNRLCMPEAQTEILQVRSRWRLVRGAIQEIYRTLNQRAVSEVLSFPDAIPLAARGKGDTEFRLRPLYFAEPGSPVERAFKDDLALIDVDRVYERLFEELNVTRLASGNTVEEAFRNEDRAAPSSKLYREIVDELGPYLLAVVIAKTEEQHQRDFVLRRLRERFVVKTVDALVVSFKFTGNPTIEREFTFPTFFLQENRVSGAGAVRERHFILYVRGHDDIGIFDIDGDALGDFLVPVFFERARPDLASQFPRIVSKYQQVNGDPGEMENYLYERLGIPLDTQQLAHDDVTGGKEETPAISTPPPPPARVVSTTSGQGEPPDDQLEEHQKQANNEIEGLFSGLGNMSGGTGPRGPSSTGAGARQGEITREQEARGKRGEEEFVRRINLPGGWEGFTLVKDARQDGCGYDFLCHYEGGEIKVEVKTFLPRGRIFMSKKELQAAATAESDYVLIGFVESGLPEQWQSAIIRNPISLLLSVGQFELDAKLQASAKDVFDITLQDDSGSANT